MASLYRRFIFAELEDAEEFLAHFHKNSMSGQDWVGVRDYWYVGGKVNKFVGYSVCIEIEGRFSRNHMSDFAKKLSSYKSAKNYNDNTDDENYESR